MFSNLHMYLIRNEYRRLIKGYSTDQNNSKKNPRQGRDNKKEEDTLDFYLLFQLWRLRETYPM